MSNLINSPVDGASAEVLEAFRAHRGFELKIRAGDFAAPFFLNLTQSEGRKMLRHYCVNNPSYLAGKSVNAYFSGSKLVGIGLD